MYYVILHIPGKNNEAFTCFIIGVNEPHAPNETAILEIKSITYYIRMSPITNLNKALPYFTCHFRLSHLFTKYHTVSCINVNFNNLGA